MRLEVKKNAKRNIIIGVVNNVILLILPFVTRTLLNTLMGSMYLGMNSLFSSILSVLSLSELGFASALVYNMYKPIADGDVDTMNALLALYKKAYRVIGFVVLTIGICLLPFVRNLINGDVPEGVNIYVVFLIELFSSSISYFLFAYRGSILAAYQRVDVTSIVNLVVTITVRILQILVIVFTRNYYLYIIVTPFSAIVNNLWVAYISKKMFPQYKPCGKLDNETLKSIKKLVAGTFIQKACGITRNSLDSICISAFLGLTLTGIYNNYYMIFASIIAMMGVISNALSGGIGNHVATKSIEENFKELCQLDLLYMIISGVCASCMLCLFQPFMRIWMGDNMLLDFFSVVLLCIYFYVLKMGDMKSLYSTANGLWWKMKFRSISETILNIILNVVLGKFYGIRGIIAATTISLFICNFIWATQIIFKSYFGINYLKKYYKNHLFFFIKTITVCVITYSIVSLISVGIQSLNFIIQCVVTVIISAGLFYALNCRTGEFKNALKMIRGKRGG